MNKKTVFITGSNSGMGLSTAKLFATKGYKVYGGVRNAETGEALKNDFNADDLAITPIICDVTNTNSVNSAIEFVVKDSGKIDILVNNAGYGLVSSVEEGTDEELLLQYNVNVFGVFRTCRAVIPFMREAESGMIINVGSFLGKMGLPLLTHYNSSKYAVEGITDSLRYELSPFGIKVHTIAPGLFKTGFVKNGLKANTKTTSEDTPYAAQANNLLPQVVDMINNGPSPDLVADAILSVVEGKITDARVPVGEDSEYFSDTLNKQTQEEFETTVKNALSL
ncbi:SDR family oxidoreductase [Photobacterium angustum]|uniref:SDR family NAD(P)-dependent oxidoreductase n=1 Tax=Photobacterium angustum TaxID=661 RepID=A0ABX5H408_PHOAN|nr:SDR family oxidoreductase [Photobacterium angustum]PSX10487.1 SDR family NAD(P)-dependent oxidoreductase [Photobacterium angustum]